eukprot:1156870-Pelagomonas_calceolata.AAC.1
MALSALSLPHQSKRGASVGLMGFWKHAAPGHQSYEWAWSFCAGLGMGSTDDPTHKVYEGYKGLACSTRLRLIGCWRFHLIYTGEPSARLFS